MLTTQEIEKFDEMAYHIRTLALRMVTRSQWGHLGGSFSLAELLAVLFGKYARMQGSAGDRDRVVLSKAHCSPALYAALCLIGRIREEQLWRYCELDGLDGHLERDEALCVDNAGGSLGVGLSTAVGMALARRMRHNFHRVYCIVGDGELQEGQIWEALMFAAQYRLDNLTILIDYNKVQAKGFLYEEIGLEPLADKLRAFGAEVVACDGHDCASIDAALYEATTRMRAGRPGCILAHTVKGKGVEAFEFNSEWHTHPPTPEQAQQFLHELGRRYGYPATTLAQPIRDMRENSLRAGMEAAR